MLYLHVVPVALRPRDPDERAALRAANGADLDGEASTRWILWLFAAVLAALVTVFTLG